MRALKKAIRRLSRWCLAIALVPLLWSLVHQLGRMMSALSAEGVRAWWLYAAGIGSYLAVEKILSRPMWLYVFGHELTHAVTGIMSGAKVHSFKAKSHGGEVELSKSNAFIALSPYVIPFYAVVVVLVYATVQHWWSHPALTPVFQFLLGAALAFHFSLTFSAIHSKQTDLKLKGFFLSGMLIAVGNALILGVLAVSLFRKTPSLTEFGIETTRETARIWMKGLREVGAQVSGFNRPPDSGLASKDRSTWTR